MGTLHQFATGPVAVGVLPGSPRDADNAAYALAENGHTVRRVRGTRMQTIAGVYDEFAAALQFPYYFGANKDAFDECLRDWRDWLGDGPDLIVVVRDAQVLLGDQPEEVAWLCEALADAGIRAVAQVRALDASSLARRWSVLGVAVVPVEG